VCTYLMVFLYDLVVNEFLLYMQNSAIRGKVLNNNVTKRTEFIINKYIAAILPVSITTGILFSIDFDAHDNYIYYSYYYSWVDTNNNFKNKFIISRINTNGTGKLLHACSRLPLRIINNVYNHKWEKNTW